MATKVEPALKGMGLVFLIDYPVQAASLAMVAGEGSDACAERWELYWDGVELANCFTELCDESEQRRRFAATGAAFPRIRRKTSLPAIPARRSGCRAFH